MFSKNSFDSQTELVETLKNLVPQAFTEGKIDLEQFRKLLPTALTTAEQKENEPKERYRLDWAGKTEAYQALQALTTATLRPTETIGTPKTDKPHILIEGENLETLKVLQKAYFGKIKMIYIDPPYNTGSDHFIYPDRFKESKENYLRRIGDIDSDGFLYKEELYRPNSRENGNFHSNWLSMIMPRLYIARNLLKEDGVIFVSIDDNEVHNLRLVMNEVFGEENFVGQITVNGNPRGRDYGGIARMHDYILVYTKSDLAEINNLPDEEKEFQYNDQIGGFDIRELRNRNIAFNSNNRPNLYYPFYINPSKRDENGFYEISLKKQPNWIELYPKESQGYKTVWRWGKERSEKFLNIAIVGKSMNDGGFQIVEKYRDKTKMARSIWFDKDVNTEKGTLVIKDLFEGKVFPFPKPVELVKRCIHMVTSSSDLILDFFAGSGTTGQAVMELNFEDGGNRQCILVQLPEKTDESSEAHKAGYKTISAITQERLRRVIGRLGERQVSELDFAGRELPVLRCFRLSPSCFKQWRGDWIETEQDLEKSIELFEQVEKDNIEPLALLYELFLKEGKPLDTVFETKTLGNYRVFVADRTYYALSGIDETTIRAILDEKPKQLICRDSQFSKDYLKTNLAAQLKQIGEETGELLRFESV